MLYDGVAKIKQINKQDAFGLAGDAGLISSSDTPSELNRKIKAAHANGLQSPTNYSPRDQPPTQHKRFIRCDTFDEVVTDNGFGEEDQDKIQLHDINGEDAVNNPQKGFIQYDTFEQVVMNEAV